MGGELREAIEGLQLTWSLGYRKVETQVDSLAALALIREDRAPTHHHVSEVTFIHELIRRDWEVTIIHT
ncbi:hypothetical protein LINPERPRIM_LOCUS11732 [Linum perenne]